MLILNDFLALGLALGVVDSKELLGFGRSGDPINQFVFSVLARPLGFGFLRDPLVCFFAAGLDGSLHR